MPSGTLLNDILLLFRESVAGVPALSGGTETWVQVADSPQAVGSGTTLAQLSCFWARASQDTPTSPTSAAPSNHQQGFIIAVSGCITTGNPWDVTAPGTTEAGPDTSISIAGDTTTVDDCLVVLACATSLPDAATTTEFGAMTNADLGSLTEHVDNTTSQGNGGGLFCGTGTKASLGAYTATTLTAVTSAAHACMSIALKPPPAGGAVSSIGTGTATATGASTASTAFSSTGAATAVATGASTAAAEMSSAGVSTGEAAGASTVAAAMSATGESTATAAGASIVDGAAFSEGSATAITTGASITDAVMSAVGVATAIAEGADASAGTIEAGAAFSTGISTTEVEGAALTDATVFSEGAATAEATGAALSDAAMSADGVSTAIAVGADAAGTIEAAAAFSTGTSTGEAAGASLVDAAMFSEGAGTAEAEGVAVGAVVEEPVVAVQVPGGGGVRDRWREYMRRRKRERELEEVELLALAEVAVKQLARDHMNRQVMR
jgi:hypothetical protein